MSQEISLEEIIKRIVVQTGHSREEILEHINEAISKVNGLLTPVGAALVLADKLKVNVDLDQLEPTQSQDQTTLKIKDLMDGMKNINVLGRIIRKFPPKTFQRNDGRQGKVASIIMQDLTGKIRVSVWDQKADIVDKNFSEGDIIGVYNGYTKKSSYNDQLQLHVGNRGMIRPKPDGVKDSDFPKDEAKACEIKDLGPQTLKCNISAKILQKYPPKTFEKDGEERQVANVRIGDNSGITRVVFWTENIKDYEGLQEGSVYDFQNLSVRKNKLNDNYELHANPASKFKNSTKSIDVKETPASNVPGELIEDFDDIPEKGFGLSIKGKVIFKSDVNHWSKNGREGDVARITLQDENLKTVNVVFWTQTIEAFNKLKMGDVIEVQDVYSKLNRERIEVSMKDSSTIKTVGTGEVEAAKKKIGDIQENQSLISFEGRVKQIEEERVFSKNGGTEGRVINFTVGDETGTINVVAWNERVEEVKELDAGDGVLIENVNTKYSDFKNIIEARLTRQSTINKLKDTNVPELEKLPESSTREQKKKKIGDIQENQKFISFEGRVKVIGDERKFTKKDGTEGHVINFTVGDETGSINVVAWEERIEEVKNLAVGDGVLIENVGTVYSDFRKMVEARLFRTSTIEKVANSNVPSLDKLPDDGFNGTPGSGGGTGYEAKRLSLKDIEANKSGEVIGHIAQISKFFNSYLACPQCNKKVMEDGDGYSCNNHGSVEKPENRLIAKFTLDDGTETITVTAIGKTADDFLGINAEEKERLLDPMERDEELEKLNKRLLLKNVVVSGRVNFNDYRDEYEILANKIIEPDIEGEIGKILEKLESSS